MQNRKLASVLLLVYGALLNSGCQMLPVAVETTAPIVDSSEPVSPTVATANDIDAAFALIRTDARTTVNDLKYYVWLVLGLYALERAGSWFDKYTAWKRHSRLEKAVNGGST